MPRLCTIYDINHDVLQQTSEEVIFPLDAKTNKILQDMQEFFSELKSPLGKPAGLAAPQIGIPLRIIIIQIPPEAKQIRKNVYDTLPPTLFLNPTYEPIKDEGQEKDWEACFSVPDKMGEVYRYNAIQFSAFTPDGEKTSRLARGFLARLIQHEVGHINGELYIDLLSDECRYGSFSEMLTIRKKEMFLSGS
jgi:peptide deformylase